MGATATCYCVLPGGATTYVLGRYTPLKLTHPGPTQLTGLYMALLVGGRGSGHGLRAAMREKLP